jgi:hypothetical protein
MKTIVKKFSLLLLLLAITNATFSQNYLKSPQAVESELKSDLNYLFQYLDKSKITSGLLSNYALELTELAPYTGVLSDTNQVSMPVLLNLYRSIYSAKINNLITLATPETVADKVKNSSAANNAVPLAMLHYEYDCFDENAVNNGWLSYSGGRLRDVSGKPSPYLKKKLFAVAPKECIFQNGTVAFVFKSDLFFRNNTKNVNKLEINFDNSGWKSASWNTPLSHTFTSGGNKNIQFRIRYSDGSNCISHTTVYVQATPVQLRAANGALYTNKTEAIGANSLHSGGTLEMHLQDPALGLRKPLIIAEPFDMSATLKVATAYNLDYIISQVPDMKAFIEAMGYDVVYVNYNNGLDDIFRNAELLKEAIRRVNAAKDKTLNTPNVVIGVSMGGLVARYALSSMEKEGEEHDVWKYISLDAPHKGANLPLGLQAMVRHVESLMQEYGSGSNGDILSQLFGVVNATATKQMLVYHCTSGGSIDNSVHNTFQAKYDAMGFPKKCQNIAVSNGALQGNLLFNPYVEIFNYQPDMGELMDFVDVKGWEQALINLGLLLADMFTFGAHSFKAEFSVHALPDKKVSNIYNGYAYFRKYFLFGIFRKTYHLTQQSLDSEASMLPLDGAAGSFNKFDLGGQGSNDAKVDTLLEHFKKKEFTFVPTGSALALSNWDTMLNTNFSGRDFYAEGLTEFEEIMVTADNKKHPNFAHAAAFLARHLVSPPVSFDLTSTGFNTSAFIPLKNPQNEAITWSTTNSEFNLSNKTNTSVVIFCEKPHQIGIISASHTVNIPAQTASTMGISSSFPVVVKKRLQSLKNISIEGGYQPGNHLATLRISNLQAGIPVSWSLFDNLNFNFRIVSSAADSVVIEALSYSKRTTVTATVSLQGKQVSVSRELTSPQFDFEVPTLNCQETEISLNTLLPNYETIEWTAVNNSNYIEFIGNTNVPKIKLKGIQNTKSAYLLLKATAKVKGETFTKQKEVTVAIPEELSLGVVKIWKKGASFSPDPNRHVVLVRALATPYNDKGVSYHWHSSQGWIYPCARMAAAAANFERVDFDKILTSNIVENQIPTKDISPALLKTLATEIAEEEEVKPEDIVVTRSAVATSNGSVGSVVLGVSKKATLPEVSSSASLAAQSNNVAAANNLTTATQSQEKYVVLTNTEEYHKPLPPIDYEQIIEIPTDDPSYALLYYSGGDVTIACNFVSPCNETLTALVTI